MRSVRTPLLAAALLAASFVPSAAPAWGARKGEEPKLRADFVDVVDGFTAVEAFFETRPADGPARRTAVRAGEGLRWKIEAGRAEIREDDASGRTFFRPLGDVPLVVRPIHGRAVGEPVVVGLAVSTIPISEQEIVAAGGGSCPQNPNHAAFFSTAVDVRAVVDAFVVPLSATQRVLRYRGAEYWSYHPNVGPIRMRYQSGKTSQILFTSLDSTGQTFFPAKADGQFYLAMEMVDLGSTIVNPQPMRLHTDSTGWPPFQVPMLAVQPTDFVDAMQPELIMMQVVQQELYLYPTTELKITALGQMLAGNQLTASFEIQNLTENTADVRWFAIGNVGTPNGPSDGLVTLGAGKTAIVTLQTTVAASGQTQYITLGAVSQAGARLSGARRISFSYAGPVGPGGSEQAAKPGRRGDGAAPAKGRAKAQGTR